MFARWHANGSGLSSFPCLLFYKKKLLCAGTSSLWGLILFPFNNKSRWFLWMQSGQREGLTGGVVGTPAQHSGVAALGCRQHHQRYQRFTSPLLLLPSPSSEHFFPSNHKISTFNILNSYFS